MCGSRCQEQISYEIRAGHAADQVMKACEETHYDLVVMTTSHLDSWLRSLFSEARKIISKINTPVLLVQWQKSNNNRHTGKCWKKRMSLQGEEKKWKAALSY